MFSKQGYDFQILCSQQHSEYYLLLEQGHPIPLFSSRKGSLSYLLKKIKEKGRVASVYLYEGVYKSYIVNLNFFFFYIGMVIMQAPVLMIVVAMCCCIYSPLRAEYL